MRVRKHASSKERGKPAKPPGLRPAYGCLSPDRKTPTHVPNFMIIYINIYALPVLLSLPTDLVSATFPACGRARARNLPTG